MSDRRLLVKNGFRLGTWEVLPGRSVLRDGEREEHLEPKVMDLLVELAVAGGEVVGKDQLIEQVWEGRAQTDEPLLRAVSVLRRNLGDNSRNPTYVQNIPRRGYRLMMPVESRSDEAGSSAPAGDTGPSRNRIVAAVGVAVAALAVVAVLAVAPWSSTPGPEASDGPIRSLAIFPFQCQGTAEPYLCFGFSEELTATLLRVEQLRIIKRSEPPPPGLSPQAVARDAGVDGLLTGNVQQVGDELRIWAELVDGRDGSVTPIESIDGDVEDVLRLQERVARIVANSIESGPDRGLVSSSRPASFEAFQAYARGQYQFERRNVEAIREAIRLFEETIGLDPLFGPAYLRLAFAYLLLPEYDPELDEETMYAVAAARAEAGIEADPRIEDAAGTVFGFIHHKRGEWLEATRAFERAIAAETTYPLAHHWYSRLLATVGRMEESLTHARRAHELDPDSAVIISRLAITHFWLSDLDAAGQYFAIANTMNLDAPIHDLAYALYLIRRGDVAGARGYTRKGLSKYGFDDAWVDPVFDGIENPEKREVAVDIVGRLQQDGRLADFILMTLWTLLDEPDRAMETALAIEGIGQDFETGFEVLFSDELSALHEHPKFPLLMEQTGLRAYWDRLGCQASGVRVECPPIGDRVAAATTIRRAVVAGP